MAVVVDRHFVLVSQATEELSLVGDLMVYAAWHLDCLAFLAFDHPRDVLLAAGNLRGETGDANSARGIACAVDLRDLNHHLELRLEFSADLAATTDQEPVLLGCDIHRCRDLFLTLFDYRLDCGYDPVHYRVVALYLDRRLVRILAREAHHPSELASVVGTACAHNEVTKGGS